MQTVRAWVSILALVLVAGAPAVAQTPACIGAGDPNGRYYAVAVLLSERINSGDACVVETAGSAENLAGLRTDRFELALVQSDLAHHQFFGDFGFERWREFRAVAPLFPEYIQILVRSGRDEPSLLGDLRSRQIGIGAAGSGSALNAEDVLNAAGLRPGLDVVVRNASIHDNLAALESGEIDALILTSAANIAADRPGLSRMPLPNSLIAELAADLAYYEPVSAPFEDAAYPTLAVRAFLLTTARADRRAVSEAAQAVLSAWSELAAAYPGMRAPDAFLQGTPFPMHPEARAVLVTGGYADPEPAYGIWIAAWVALLMTSLTALVAQTNYDRTGNRRERRGRWAPVQRAADWWARPSPWIVGLSLFVLALLISLMALRGVEGAHARAQNLDNPFVDFTLNEGFMWMLTYVSSGFTENDAFPMTVPGRIIVATLALIGVTGPIAAILVLVSFWNRRRAEAVAGLAPKLAWKNHILVCGWNEKLDGVVYALTSHDAEDTAKVCIVAQAGDASPVANHRFDSRTVKFRRGDSAEREVLSLAHAEKARHAIILADYARRASGNVGAVLTAMQLKRLKPDISISAELAFSQNADHFASFGCRTLITPDIFVAKAAALSTVHPLIIDFLLEALTYDIFDEIYAIGADELAHRNPGVTPGMTLTAMEETLQARGVNLVGLVEARTHRDAVYEAEITEFGSIRPLLTAKEMRRPLRDDDTIIYAARQRSSIFNGQGASGPNASFDEPAPRLRLERPQGAAMLLYASHDHLDRLEANLRAYHIDPFIHRIAIEDQPFLTRARLEACLPQGAAFDHAIVMASATARHSAETSEAVRAIDAGTLLTAKLIREFSQKRGWSCTVTAEALHANDRAAFISHEDSLGGAADIVIPSSTLVERFLVKEASDGNGVLDFLIAIMNMRDGTHLAALEVASDDPLIGSSYAALVGPRFEGARLVGWLPITKREELRNRAGDFDFHFRTAFNDKIEQTHVQAGDVLIFTACFKALEARGDRHGV